MIHKAARLAEKIREKSVVDVRLVSGKASELTVIYNGEIIAAQGELFLPQKKILEIILSRSG